MTTECEEIVVAASPTKTAVDYLNSTSTSNVRDKTRPPANNNPGPQSSRKKTLWLREAISLLIEQWFLISLGLLIAIASQVQVPSNHQKLKRTVTSYLCISIIFLVTGCTLDTKVLLQNYGRWKIHLFVQLQCFLMTSALVFGLVSASATSKFLDPGLLVGLIFMSCVATTIASNVVMTRQAHGNQPLTVVQTTVGNLIGAFVSPSLVIMYTSAPTWYNAILPQSSGQFGEIYRRVLKQLGLSIYVPLFVGQVVRYFFPKACKKIFVDWKLNKIGSVSLLVVLWATYDQAFASHSFDSVPASNMVFIVFISVGLWLTFFAIAFFSSIIWLPREDTVSICYCVPAKGIVMGVPLSTTIFAGIPLELQSRIEIPIVIYQGLQLAFGSILVSVFRKWVDAERDRSSDQERSQAAVNSAARTEEKT